MPSFPIHNLHVKLATLSGVAILLVGCQSIGGRMMARAEREDTCGANPLRAFVGRKADQFTRKTIEQRLSSAERLRWIVPGEDTLADLNTGRINVALDDNGTIQNVGCY